MDALLPAIVGSVPQLGGAGLLVLVVVLLIRREMQMQERFAAELARTEAERVAEVTRVDQSRVAEITRIEAARTGEMTRLEAEHDSELRRKDAEIEQLRERNLALNQWLEHERVLRRAAEDGGRHRPAGDAGPSPWAPA
jgi:hypothetical protein